MYFPGDRSSRRKVDLGGRSSKEKDRQKVLEEARVERDQRKRVQVRNQSAGQIQKWVRGERDVAAARRAIREDFSSRFGEHGERAAESSDGDQVFSPASKFLPQLFFFFQQSDAGDCLRLVQACRLLQQQFVRGTFIAAVFRGNCPSDWPVAEHRAKRLAKLCISTLHFHRAEPDVKDGLWKPAQRVGSMSNSATLLMDTVLILTGNELPWSASVVDYLVQNKLFHLLRDIFLMEPQVLKEDNRRASCMESAVVLLASRHLQRLQTGTGKLFQWSFAIDILSIPLLWQRFPAFKEECVNKKIWEQSVLQIASSLPELKHLLPKDTSEGFPSNVCLLGNIVEVAGEALSEERCTLGLASAFALVARYLMEELPPCYYYKSPIVDEGNDDETEVDGPVKVSAKEPALDSQLQKAANFELLKNLVKVTFSGSVSSSKGRPSAAEAAAVGAVCAFLYACFIVLPPSSVVQPGLAFRGQLVPQLWQYIKRCHVTNFWPSLELEGRSAGDNQVPGDLLGWMLPLAIFCPVFSYLLITTDDEEFYNQQRPISLEDLVQLVPILKEALWHIMWVMNSKSPTTVHTPRPSQSGQPMFSPQAIRDRVGEVTASLLAALHDRNSMRQFTSPQDFHAREAVEENFFAEAERDNTRAHYLLQKAPFLVPFIDRVRIYTSQLTIAREADRLETPFGRLLVRIRRDHTIEDAFSQLNPLSGESLRGSIRVTFVNELGVEEAGVDGGGIFKDFMENITRAAFDIQYGLFKETADHLLYPNPSSSMMHDDHLHYFEFLGKILGKAMFEGILVDIPFATFFLSKLRNKHNFLHDLPSLDPGLYRNLLFLKNYSGDLSQLGLYFSIENNEYGEQEEIELLPGGKDEPVTHSNKIRYIHLVANHRLNSQISLQSSRFLVGFQQLIKTEWINMFNEQELQILISGSQEGMDVNDLRANINYSGGYSENHPVIEMFWDVVRTLDLDQQRKFLKFVTGCSRGPLLGFKHLEPQFCIHRAATDDSSEETLDRLPTSSTCVNLLKLPPYRSKEVIYKKLMYAITAGAGFELS